MGKAQKTEVDTELEALLGEDVIASEALADLEAESDAEDDLEALLDEVEGDEDEAAMEAAAAEIESEQVAASANEAAPGDADEVVETEKKKATRVCTQGMRPSEIIDLKIGDDFKKLAVIREGDEKRKGKRLVEHMDKLKAAIDELPKKVGEKAVNIFQHLNNGAELSCYTHDAIAFLRESGGFTKKELHDFYAADNTGVNSKPYSQGTAGAQSSQMMKLLPALGIAERDGMSLKPAEDSILFDMLAN